MDLISLTLLLFGFFVLCLIVPYTVLILLHRRKYAHIPGPPARGIKGFYLGIIPTIAEKAAKGSFFAEMIYESHLKYGRIFVFHFLHKSMVNVTDQAAIKDVLVTRGLPKSPLAYDDLFSLFGQRFLGNGLVTDTNNERWAKRRLQMNSTFHRGYLKGLISTFNSTADAFVGELAKVADGTTTVKMLDYLNRVTLDVIGKVAFNMDIDSIHNTSSPFPDAIFNSFSGMSYYMNNFIRGKIPWLDRKMKYKTSDAIKFLREKGLELFQKRQAAIEAGENVPQDILTQVCRYKVNDPSFDLESALDDFLTFFVAGQETTANTMAFILMECGRNPEVMKKLRDEIYDVVGDSEEVTYENIMALEYSTMVIKESLRLYPVGPQTFRVTTDEMELAGYTVPKGTTIGVSFYAAHRLPSSHQDPLQFDPERFHPDSIRKPSMYTYLPFSLGPRNCLGQTFAQIEAKILLAKMIQKFNIDIDMSQSFDIKEVFTLKPKDGCRCTLTPRGK